MNRGQFGTVGPQLRHLFEGRSIAGDSEWQLLHRYLDRRDEVAFEAIVTRHGPMVLGVCRRLLFDARDVEDAFQATFVILAKKGGTLRESDPVAHWLYGVAYRVALKARASAARRRRLEGSSQPFEVPTMDDPSDHGLAEVLDEELARLPTKYRAPVVLCYLEGQTHEKAAQQLGWPLGTVKGRLARARDLLKARLSRRGVAPGMMIGLVPGSQIFVPRPLLDITMRAAQASRSAGMVPVAVSTLVAGSLSTMFMNKLKAVGMVGLVLGAGAAVMVFQMNQVNHARAQSLAAAQAQVKSMPSPNVPPKVAAPASTEDVNDWVAGWPELTNPPEDSKSKAILEALEKPIPMHFPNDTPLEDVIKYIREATEGSPGLPKGIPIYVDPVGLQDADKTMDDTVVINLEEVPLKYTFKLLLKQLNLTYMVRDGILTITSTIEDDEITPFSIMEGKAIRGELTREQYKQLIEALKMKRQVQSLVGDEGGAFGSKQ